MDPANTLTARRIRPIILTSGIWPKVFSVVLVPERLYDLDKLGVVAIYPVMDLSDRITIYPEQCGGRPCIRGICIRVSWVRDLLANGLSREQVLEELPDLEPDDVSASLQFAACRIDHPILAARSSGEMLKCPPTWRLGSGDVSTCWNNTAYYRA